MEGADRFVFTGARDGELIAHEFGFDFGLEIVGEFTLATFDGNMGASDRQGNARRNGDGESADFGHMITKVLEELPLPLC